MMVDLFWGCQMGDVPKMAGLGRVRGGEMGPARSGIGLDPWGDREGANPINPIVNIGLRGATPHGVGVGWFRKSGRDGGDRSARPKQPRTIAPSRLRPRFPI